MYSFGAAAYVNNPDVILLAHQVCIKDSQTIFSHVDVEHNNYPHSVFSILILAPLKRK